MSNNKPFVNLRKDGLNFANLILIVTCLVLVGNLFYLNRQIDLTQVLNQPLCAVKEIKVAEVKEDPGIIKISAVIANSGNYVAKDASIQWELSQVKDLKAEKPSFEKIEGWHSSPIKPNIAILPKQEFDYFLMYLSKDKFDAKVQGYLTGVLVNVTVTYKDMNDEKQEYRCSFLITRLGPPNTYESQLQSSSIQPQPTKGKFSFWSGQMHSVQTYVPSNGVTISDVSNNVTVHLPPGDQPKENTATPSTVVVKPW